MRRVMIIAVKESERTAREAEKEKERKIGREKQRNREESHLPRNLLEWRSIVQQIDHSLSSAIY